MENMEYTTAAWTALDSWRARRAAVFGRWLTAYFWIALLPLILDVVSSLTKLNRVSALLLVLLGYAGSVCEVMIFYQLGQQEEHFETCAGLSLVVLIVGIVMELLCSEVAAELLRILRSIIALVAVYHFMIGCADILLIVDEELSEKWRWLWKWYIGLQVGTIAAEPVVLIVAGTVKNSLVATLILILMRGIVITLNVLEILYLVYLYRTARRFREISKNVGLCAEKDTNG